MKVCVRRFELGPAVWATAAFFALAGFGCGSNGGTAGSSSPGAGGTGTAGAGVGGSTTGAGGANGAAGGTSAAGTSGRAGAAGAGVGGASAGVGGAAGAGGSGVAGRGGTSGNAGISGSTGAAGRGGSGGSSAGSSGGGGNSGSSGRGGAGAAGAGGTAAGGAAGASTHALIHNDVFWKDTAGNPIYSQGGGVLQVGSTFYWYGVRYGGAATYAASPNTQNSDTSFVAITTYSSTDLATWKLEGNAVTYDSMASKLAMTSTTWVGRVGAAYNTTTKKYVIVGQYLGSPDTQQFFATSDTPNGGFVVDHAQPTITNVANNNCGDQSVFTDDDGKAYIVCSSLSGRSNIYIVPLRPTDFLEAEPATRIFNGAGREGNAMFKHAGRYYVCSSDLHGWNASHTYCISATTITGPYGTEAVMGNTDLDFSHVTQTGLFITVKGSAQETVIFGGDRWADFAGNGIGYNQWMPLSFNGTAPVMQSLSVWSIDPATGAWSVGPGNNYVMNPSFEADRVATNPPAGWTTTAGADVTSTHTGNFAWQLSGAASVDQSIASLPAGTYTLAVWINGTGSGTLWAKGCGGADKNVALSSGSGWRALALTGVSGNGGACDVGATTTSGTVTLDDFTLTAN